MKKITILTICVFLTSLGIIGFAQTSQYSETNVPDTNIKNEILRPKSTEIETMTVPPGDTTSSMVDSRKLQNAGGNPGTQQLPVHIVMDELVFHIGFLEGKIEENSANGKDTKELLKYYRRRAGLTDDEDKSLKREVKEITKSLKDIDKQIQAITQAYRAKVSNGILPGDPLPDIPAQLTVLKNERENLLASLPEILRTNMGEAGYRKLDAFVQKEIAPRIRPIMASGTRNISQPSPTTQP